MAHVLVVNDDVTVARMLDMIFTEDGHHVTRARTNTEALAVLRSSLHPVVALLRLEVPPMPRNDARVLPLLEVIRDRRATWEPHAYVLVTWGYPTGDAAIDRLVDELGVHILHMPTDSDGFLSAVAEAAATFPARP